MEALSRDGRIRAFKATDAFAIEAYRISRALTASAHDGLAGEIRRQAVRCGGALVAAAASQPGGKDERRLLERARVSLIQGHYCLYLARRLGLIDLKLYRALGVRQDAAIRELETLLRPVAAAMQPLPP